MTFVIKLAQGLEESHHHSSPAPKLTGKGKQGMKRKMWGSEAPAGWKNWEQSNKMLLIVRLKAQWISASKIPQQLLYRSKIVIAPRSRCLQ